MSCKYSGCELYASMVIITNQNVFYGVLTFPSTGWLLLEISNCLYRKQLLPNPALPTLQPLPYTCPLMSQKHNNTFLSSPNTLHNHDNTFLLFPSALTVWPTVEDVGCNPGFQNVPLMTVRTHSE